MPARLPEVRGEGWDAGALFGTDGVRGLAGPEISPELAVAVARAAATWVRTGPARDRRPRAVVGRDTRPSGEFLEAATVAGLASAGMDVDLVGVCPTGGVAVLTALTDADLGVMLSASHNPMADNGIKLFAAGGHKLPDAAQEVIARLVVTDGGPRPSGTQVGRARQRPELLERYVEGLLASLPHRLDGLRVVVDCAQGAASWLAPQVLAAAGAQVSAIAADGDGEQINAGCGVGDLGNLRAAVLASGAHVGIAHDGDADRCLAIDHTGAVVDGDAILAICAVSLAEAGRLPGRAVVTTVMANLGFRQAMARKGIAVRQVAVGDRYVLEELHASGAVLGGEQSGHLIFLDHAPTGDGLLTSLQLLARVAATGRPLAELAAVVPRYPQALVNVAVGPHLAQDPAVLAAARAAADELGEQGRVLVRGSGTERCVRVMVEAPTEEVAVAIAARLAEVVRVAG